jgi:hypothetical protein
MVDLLVYTNHRMGDMYYNTPFPHNVLSIVKGFYSLGRFFFREVSVNRGEYWSYIVLGSAFVKKSTPGIRSAFICWTRIEAKRNAFSIHPSFGILLAGWRFFIYSFSFEKYESDIDRVIYLRSSIVTFWWSEIETDVSSHFDEAKFQLIYRRISRIRAKTSMPSLAIWKRRWVYRIPRWERRRVCRVLQLLSRAKMSISNLVIIESEDEYFESCE